MNNKRNRKLALVVAVVMLTLAFSSTGFAAWMGKTMEAQYRNISIFVNSEFKQATDVNGKVVEPFIVDGTTYVPLRGIAQMLGYQVGFNPATYRIDITGNVAGSTSALQYQLLIKDARIAELEAKLAEKESVGIDDLEDELNAKFTRIDRIVSISEIELKETKSSLEVGIYVNLKTTGDLNDWKEVLDDGEVKAFIQDIVDYIDDNYDEYDVEDIKGFIEDNYDKSELVSFTVNSRGVVSLSNSSSGSTTWSATTLRSDLRTEFRGDYGITDFQVSGDVNNIEIDVYVIKADWDSLTRTLKNQAKEEIISFIEYDYPKANIDGLILSDEASPKQLDSFLN